MKRSYQLSLWLPLLVTLTLGAEPLSDGEKNLSDADFATQEMTECHFDKIYFLPNNAHRALKVIRGLIYGAQKKIRTALFRLTEPSIAKALIDAHKRGVSVEVVVDPGALEKGHYSKVFDLIKAGIPVYRYITSDLFLLSKNSQSSKYQTIMHLKFLSCDAPQDKKMVMLGSLNFTHAGVNGNVEVVEIRDNQRIAEDFEKTFESLKRCSELLTPADIPPKVKKQSVTSLGQAAKQDEAPRVRHSSSDDQIRRLVTQGVPYIRRVVRMVH